MAPFAYFCGNKFHPGFYYYNVLTIYSHQQGILSKSGGALQATISYLEIHNQERGLDISCLAKGIHQIKTYLSQPEKSVGNVLKTDKHGDSGHIWSK